MSRSINVVRTSAGYSAYRSKRAELTEDVDEDELDDDEDEDDGERVVLSFLEPVDCDAALR